MATITITPTTYYLSNSSYLSVSSASNMYADCDSTTYATVTNSRTSTTSYYLYVRGFDLSQVPSDAIVSDVAVRVKARHSGGYAQAMYLYDGTSTSYGSSSTTLSTTATTHAINVTHDWADLAAAGSDLGIRINCRRSNRNTTAYVYVYGAEIEVTYSIPVYHSVTLTNTTSATVAVSDSSPLEGSDVTVTADTLSGITITDNGTDVTDQFVEKQETGASYEVETAGDYGFALNGSTGYYVSENEGISKTAALCKVNVHVPVDATLTFTYINYAEQGYDFGVFGNIDVALSDDYYAAGSSGATITDSSYRLACNTSSHNTSNTQTLSYSLTAGDHSIWVKYSKDDASSDNYDTLQFKVAITLDEPFTPGSHYEYTITNVADDHAIVVTAAGPKMYVKQGGAWVTVTKAYRKASGAWQEVALADAFSSSGKYVVG